MRKIAIDRAAADHIERARTAPIPTGFWFEMRPATSTVSPRPAGHKAMEWSSNSRTSEIGADSILLLP
jgi:hypothetical protein